MRTLIISALLLSVAFTEARPASQTADGAVYVTVVGSNGGGPVGDAEIRLRGTLTEEDGSRRVIERTGVTSAAGQAVFRDLPPAGYRVLASREGYFGVGLGGAPGDDARGDVVIGPGTTASYVNLELAAPSTISGSIRDRSGEPVVGAEVTLLELEHRFGRTDLGTLSSALVRRGGLAVTSDDRGAFRLFGIPPGAYYVRADPAAPEDGEVGAYTRYVYAPGTFDADMAAPISIRGGESLFAHVRLPETEGLRISGRVVLPGREASTDGLPPTLSSLFLVPRGRDTVEAPVELRLPAGNGDRFAIAGVPDGEYDLYPLVDVGADNATAPGYYTNPTRIRVAEADIGDLALPVRRGAEVRIAISVAGEAPEAALEDISQLNVELIPREVLPSLIAPRNRLRFRELPDRVFTFGNVVDGRYRLVVQGFALSDTYVSEVLQGGRSIGDDPTIVVASGRAEPVEVILSRGTARVNGLVRDANGQPVAGAQVVLLPEPPRQENLMHYARAGSRETGAFVLAEVPPGTYRILAVETLSTMQEMSPAWQAANPGGPRLVLAPGDILDLRIGLRAP